MITGVLAKAIVVTAAAALFVHGYAAETPYPVRNVTIVVPFAAGGSADILTRGLGKGLAEAWGRSIIVENRPGAASMIGAERTPLVPGLPTIAESGVPGYSYENWWGLFTPAKTPAAVVSAINATVNKVLAGAEMKQLLEREGAAAAPMTVVQLADLLPKEIALYRKMAQAAGMKPE